MLQPFYYLVLEGFAFVICFLIYLNLRAKKSPMIDENIFMYLILANMVILCADILTWYTDGKTFTGAHVILTSANVLYYVLSSVILFLWMLYVSLRTSKNNSKHRTSIIIAVTLPIVFELVMSVTAPFNGLYFYVDDANVYHRGPWCWTQAVIGIIYMLFSVAIAFVNFVKSKHSQEKKESMMLVVFTIFPLLCSAVQSQYFGLPLIWIGTTISFLIFFIQTQNSQISLDELTKLNNRRKFEAYIWQGMRELKSTETLFLVVIDIDNFKTVNDTYGHIEGDKALIALSDLLKKACTTGKDFAARYGGDEFALICIRPNAVPSLTLIDTLLKSIDDYNKQSDKPYDISISYGVAAYRHDTSITEDVLKQQADAHMYEMKAAHHEAAANI